MAPDEFGYSDYLKAAFTRRAGVPLLGRLPLNYFYLAAVAVLGIANPGFWLLGAAGEVGYLTLLASAKRFRKLVRGERLLEDQKRHLGVVERSVSRLEPAGQKRYRRLLGQCHEVLGLSEALDLGSLESVSKMRTGGLNQLLAIFLRLLTSRQALVATLANTDREQVEGELRRVEKRLEGADEDTTLGRSLRGTYDIQRKRLDNLDRAESNLEILDAELSRIEQQVALLREETAVSGKADALSDRLDAVTGALEETNRWMAQHAEIFGAVDGTEVPATGLPALTPPVPAESTNSSRAE